MKPSTASLTISEITFKTELFWKLFPLFSSSWKPQAIHVVKKGKEWAEWACEYPERMPGGNVKVSFFFSSEELSLYSFIFIKAEALGLEKITGCYHFSYTEYRSHTCALPVTIQTPTMEFRHQVGYLFFRSGLSFACQQFTWIDCGKERKFKSHCVGWSMWLPSKAAKNILCSCPLHMKNQPAFLYLYLVCHCKMPLPPWNTHVLRTSTARSSRDMCLRGREKRRESEDGTSIFQLLEI